MNMYVAVILTPRPDLPEVGEVTRVPFFTREAAEEAVRRANEEGKDAFLIIDAKPIPLVGQGGIIEDIQWR
jgi:hypothetical protein